jgi:hypothetical protein
MLRKRNGVIFQQIYFQSIGQVGRMDQCEFTERLEWNQAYYSRLRIKALKLNISINFNLYSQLIRVPGGLVNETSLSQKISCKCTLKADAEYCLPDIGCSWGGNTAASWTAWRTPPPRCPELQQLLS